MLAARDLLTRLLLDFVSIVSVRLPDDVLEHLVRASKVEEHGFAGLVYEAMFRNLEVSSRRRVPLCQDTGVLEFFIRVGDSFPYTVDLLDAVPEAVARATEAGFLRPNVVDPVSGVNTGDNVGPNLPWVDLGVVRGVNHADVFLYLAGGGSSRPGSARVLDPAQGLEGVVRYVLETVSEYGPPACPPLVVGVGIGPTAEIAALLSKRALLRPLGSRSPNPKIASLEEELERAINALGIGPQGLGGKVTALAVHVEYSGRHPATLAVGVSTSCWAMRRGHLRIEKDLSASVLSHGGVKLGKNGG
jgi:L(+)-tartrate dehydratase alpha subunit